jgi:adenine-specific DNA-methyltransferase
MKNNLGQYFTTNIILKEKIYNFIINNPDEILEPSIGQGDLIVYVKEKNSSIKFDMYEIDEKIKLLDNIEKENVVYCDFLQQNITKLYKTIIGNPPYIKCNKKSLKMNLKMNLYIEFAEKCYNLLEDKGELIFIVPSDFLKLTSSSKLINIMMNNGTFTHIYHPNNEKMFENASIDIIIFRYCKNKLLEKKVLYNDQLKYIINNDGLITFSEEKNNNIHMFKDYFDIYVGIVSGKEEVYKNNTFGNIDVLNGYNKTDKYIYIESYPSKNEDLNKYLLEHKDVLIKRGIRKFNEKNWFEFGANRNIKNVKNNLGKECIYIYNLTRNDKVAFLDKVTYFGGNLIILIPKKECNLNIINLYLNSDEFKDNFIFSGRFKIGHRQLSNSFIPNNLLNI